MSVDFEMFPILRNDADHQRALETLKRFWGADLGSPEGRYALVLIDLIEAYETRTHRVGLPDPIEAIEERMADLGWNRRDLEPYIGSRGRVSDVLNRKRGLSIAMIRRLAPALGLSADVLIQPTVSEDEAASAAG